jgi:hypothetical protein
VALELSLLDFSVVVEVDEVASDDFSVELVASVDAALSAPTFSPLTDFGALAA